MLVASPVVLTMSIHYIFRELIFVLHLAIKTIGTIVVKIRPVRHIIDDDKEFDAIFDSFP